MSVLILILIILIIYLPLIVLIFRIFTYGKFLLDMDLTKNIEEKVIKEGISIPSFEFNISKSTIGFLMIILSAILLIFTTNGILKNINNNIDFVKKTFIVDNNIHINKKKDENDTK